MKVPQYQRLSGFKGMLLKEELQSLGHSQCKAHKINPVRNSLLDKVSHHPEPDLIAASLLRKTNQVVHKFDLYYYCSGRCLKTFRLVHYVGQSRAKTLKISACKLLKLM